MLHEELTAWESTKGLFLIRICQRAFAAVIGEKFVMTTI
jgi:hypothetical protein